MRLYTGNSPVARTAFALFAFLAFLLTAAPAAAQSPTQPTKEYIRAGGKLIAIEIPGAGAGTDNAVAVSITAPDTVTAGASFTATVRMRNTGTTTWPASSNYQLGSANPSNNTTWGSSRVPLSQAVSPNGEVDFVFTATAPLSTGLTSFSWQMIKDSSTWFGAIASKNITVSAPSSGPPPISVSLLPSNPHALGPSEDLVMTAFLTNASNPAVTWTATPSNVGTLTTNFTGYTIYTAPSNISEQQALELKATSVEDPTKSASVTVTLRPTAATMTPLVTFLTPNSPNAQDVTFSLNAQGGSSNVSQVRLYLGFDAQYNTGGCLILYDRLTGRLYLRGDGTDDTWVGFATIGSGETQENSQCKIFGSGSSESNYGRNTQLAIKVQSKTAWAGSRDMKVWLNNTVGNSWGWESVGAWNVPASTQYVAPSTRNAFAGQFVQLSAFTSPAGQAVTWSMSPSVGTLNASTGLYQAPSSIASQQTVTVTARRQSDNALIGTSTLTLKPVSGSGSAPTFNEIKPDAGKRSGLAEVFKFRFFDANGPNTIDEIRVRFSATAGTDQNNCSFRWTRNGSVIELFNDAGNKLEGPIAAGIPNISNSACTLVGASLNAFSWGSTGYNPMELVLGIGFGGSFASGTKNIYVAARDNTGRELPWTSVGTWTFPSGGSAPTISTNSGYPQGSPTVTQKFGITVNDANGYTDINEIQFVVTDRAIFPAPNTCHIFYFLDSNMGVTLADDGLQWADIGEVNPGWPYHSNSQCDFFVGETDRYNTSSTAFLFQPKFRLKGSFATTKSVYAKVTDNAGLGTSYQYLGSFTISGASNAPVYLVPKSERDPLTGKQSVWVEVAGAQSDGDNADAQPAREEE